MLKEKYLQPLTGAGEMLLPHTFVSMDEEFYKERKRYYR